MFNLARGLTDFGHNVSVITHNRKPLACLGVNIIQIPLPGTKRTLRRKIQRWRTEPYHTWSRRAYEKFVELDGDRYFDIIEVAEYAALGRYFLGRCKVPIVVKLHSPHRLLWQADKSSKNGKAKTPLWLRVLDKYERRQTNLANAVVSPSFALAGYVSLTWRIAASRIAVLPNPIDTDLFSPADVKKKDVNEILYVGRLQRYKGVLHLTKAINPLLKQYPNLKVRFIGMDIRGKNGDLTSDKIYALIPTQYHNRINFNGHMPAADIVSFQQRALCTVVPTQNFESFSYTVLEAMSCGCPVISTYCGGPAEIITDEVDGLLVPTGSTNALTTALRKLIDNPQLREKLASQARRTSEKRFSISVVLPRIVKLYEDIVRAKYQKIT